MYQAAENRYDTMQYARCGHTGAILPKVSLGLWHNFGGNGDFENMKAMCFTAFDNGICSFDLANNYGPPIGSAEANFGRILSEELGAYRDELFISTKAGFRHTPGPYGDGGGRKYLLSSLDASLKRLGLDYVDVFYHHRMDPETPLEETMMALDTAVKSGKALYAGVSNYDGDTTRRAAEILKELKCPFILNQSSYSILNRHIERDGLKGYASAGGCGIIAYSPLHQGILTGKYLKGIPVDSRIRTDGRFLHESDITSEKQALIAKLGDLASKRGQTLAQMALAWILRDGIVTSVLVGASRPSQILDSVKAVENTKFTAEELAIIDKICTDYGDDE